MALPLRFAALATIAVLLVAIGPAPAAGSGGKRCQGRYPMVVTGRPVIRGNAPFTYVCILSTDGRIYYVFPDSQGPLRRLPPRQYRFYGRLHEGDAPTLEATRYPDGTLIVEKWEPVDDSADPPRSSGGTP